MWNYYTSIEIVMQQSIVSNYDVASVLLWYLNIFLLHDLNLEHQTFRD